MTLLQSNPWSGIELNLQAFSPMVAMTCTMLLVVAAPIIIGRSSRSIAAVASVGIIASMICVWRVAPQVLGQPVSGLSTDPGAGLLIADNLSISFQGVLLLFMAGVTWLWWMGSADQEENAPEFFILLIGSALGMAMMVSTTNLLMIVMAIELASLPSYAIVGFDKRDRRGAEASLKYMVFGAVSAAVMLYGMSLLYGLVGSLSLNDIARYTATHMGVAENFTVLTVGLLCLLAGIAFKISAVPFHFWCPDAFEGAKIEVTTWLSVASKAAALLLLARIVAVFCAAPETPVGMTYLEPLAWTIGIVAAITCTVGNLSAYKQDSVKRLLAYSSIAHAGYMMMAAAVFIHPDVKGYEAGLTALVAYIIIYLFMNLGAFGVTAIVVWDTGDDGIDKFNGMIRRAPWLAIPMIVCLMSLVGLPPFAGFIGKWWVLVALGSLGSTLGWVLIVVAAINTLISLYFYMRIVVRMTLRDDGQPGVSSPIGGIALVNGCAVALIALLLYANPMKAKVSGYTRNLYAASVTASPVAQDALAKMEPSD